MVTELTTYKRVLKLMGNRFEFSVVGDSSEPALAESCIDLAEEEVRRIERLLTTFDDSSQTNQVNRAAGISPVAVDREFFNLVQRSVRLSQLTQGAFDLTYGSVDKRLWNFDRTMTALPDPDIARQMVRLINYRNIELDEANCTVFLKEKGMRIGFGGIGKGYAAEMAKKVLQKAGVENGIVNAAGDLCTWGVQPDGKAWTIGIASPDAAHLPFSYLNVSDVAVATSGNYEKYVMIGGKRYSHTIDPRTGLPVQGIRSVTIICPNAEIADAMATPVMIMGKDVGLDMINQMKNIACIIIDDRNRLYTSKNISIQ